MKVFFEILIGILVGFIFLIFITKEKVNFGDFALGDETISVFGMDNHSYPIHISSIGTEEYQMMIEGWEKRGGKDVVLILGNSQTHSINQWKENQKTYNHLLFEKMEDSLDVLTFSIPNANLQELYVAFQYFQVSLPIKKVFLPIFMDDLREDGFRPDAFGEIEDWSFIYRQKLKYNSDLLAKVQKHFNEKSVQNNDEDLAGIRETVQEKSEKYLNNRLNQFEIWENRPTIRGKIFTNMYIFRNTILGINAQTKRSMIPKKYAENLSAFTAFLNFAKNKQIEPIIYIPPIRGDVDIPYVKSEYQQLKNDLDRIVVEIDDSNRIYIFDNIVPGELWGYKAATNWFGDEELDFMHFQFEGHKILYKTFLNEFFVKE